MYAKCGQLEKAKELLDLYKSSDIFSWTDLIRGYVRNGQNQEALNCFDCMEQEGLCPNAATFTCILKVCANMRLTNKGEQIHDVIIKRGLLEKDIVLGNALVDMHVKLGNLSRALSVLDDLPVRDVVSWSTLIAGYAEHGQYEQALNSYHCMQLEGLSPDVITLTCMLKACANTRQNDKGEQIHDEIIRQGLLDTDVVLGNTLVDMYIKCGAFAKAERLLRELPIRDVVSWSALIAGYAQVGQGAQALMCFEQMQEEGLSPDAMTFACILKACGSMKVVDEGEKIHEEIVRWGLLKNNVVLGNALLHMYVKFGNLDRAYEVLKTLSPRDVVSWSTLIAGYAQDGQGEQALKCYEQMLNDGHSPNAITYICTLKACGHIGAVNKGQQIHDEVARQGLLNNNVMLGNAVADMYVKCDALEKAWRVLEELPVQNAVSWNVIISGYAKQGQAESALESFEMMHRNGLLADSVTFLGVLKACGSKGAVEKGEQIHNLITRMGLLSNNLVLGNAIINMYAKCGALTKAQGVLEALSTQDVVSWNTLISGYIEQGQVEEALNCYGKMQRVGLSPNSVTFLCILRGCTDSGAFDKGIEIHEQIARQGLLGTSPELGVAILNMYAELGDIEKAYQVLNELHLHNIVLWNTLIGGYAKQGKGEQVLKCFREMQLQGLLPDAMTLVHVLRAYGIMGRPNDAQLCFMNMKHKYGIMPKTEHFTCLIDILAKSGYLDQAAAIIQKTPSFICTAACWSALLTACQKLGDVNVGIWAFEQALKNR
ncbi:hypothetical protein KP509_13G052000 [Ceratopteris richardii]|nr:hypothetical protein KP509_13G052000 [Ceratopteris richardii]